ncbi:MAG: 50S ribosome-binding GTPase [Deltaproteobacteria bacterium]|nr:50S ribosome-binding GTPase [Deltaproteobacteria bacterium]
MNAPAPELEARLLNCRRRLGALNSELEALPHWHASQLLRERIAQISGRILELENEPERKLAILILGPSGAGKSTLLNALAGQDNLAEVGAERPTTRELAVFCSQPEDGRYFMEKTGVDHARIVTSPMARELNHLLIVDTPDINSVEGEKRRGMVEAALAGADVLVCAFSADCATRRDQVDFLKPWVERFNADAVYIVVTMSEKLSRKDLGKNVMTPLRQLLEGVWSRNPLSLFAVSARTHLLKPQWKPGEEAAPDFRDDFPKFRAEIAERLNSPEYARDMRGARAEEWTGGLEDQALREAVACAGAAGQAYERLNKLSREIWRAGVEKISHAISAAQLEFQMARRMWGPLSWCLLAWAFFLRVVELLTLMGGFLLRFSEGGPKNGPSESMAVPDGSLLNEVERVAGAGWPDMEAALRKAGFSASFRANPLRGEAGAEFTRRLESRVRAEWERLTITEGKISGFGTQLILNLLFLAPVVFLLWSGAMQIWLQKGLAEGYGRDGVFFVGLWWILVLALTHGWIGLKVGKLFSGDSFSRILQSSRSIQPAAEVRGELERLLILAGENPAEFNRGTQ